MCGLLDIEELRHGMLASLRRALASDWVSLNEVAPDPAEILTIAAQERCVSPRLGSSG